MTNCFIMLFPFENSLLHFWIDWCTGNLSSITNASYNEVEEISNRDFKVLNSLEHINRYIYI